MCCAGGREAVPICIRWCAKAREVASSPRSIFCGGRVGSNGVMPERSRGSLMRQQRIATQLQRIEGAFSPRSRRSTTRRRPFLSDFAPPAADRIPDHVPFNYVSAHWRGEFSVAAALFGNGTIVGLILIIGATIFVTILKDSKVTPITYAGMIAALLVIYLVSVVWLLVGICRSAWRRWSRRSMGGRPDLKPNTQSIATQSITAHPPPPPPAPS
jgi:hypothetical protein